MKIYCNNCKYYYFPNVDGSSIYDYCKLTKRKKHTATHYYYTFTECIIMNLHNNCLLYKRKWWKFWVKQETQ